MRLVLAVIASACFIAVLIDTPRRELEEELKQQWQEYRQHVGETTLAQCAGLTAVFSVRNYF